MDYVGLLSFVVSSWLCPPVFAVEVLEVLFLFLWFELEEECSEGFSV